MSVINVPITYGIDYLTSPVTVTGSWADLSPDYLRTEEYDLLGIWMKIAANDSLNIQFRCVGTQVPTPGSDEYAFGIATTDTNLVKIDDQVYELKAFGNRVLTFALGSMVPQLKIQWRALTVGSTPAQIASALAVAT